MTRTVAIVCGAGVSSMTMRCAARACMATLGCHALCRPGAKLSNRRLSQRQQLRSWLLEARKLVFLSIFLLRDST